MKQLKEGYTTGACATAASVASVLWQKTGKCPKYVQIDTPIGRTLVLDVFETEQFGKCYVIKDGGDDPDVTHGCQVHSFVELQEKEEGQILFCAGNGVGIVTEEGLKVSKGEPAINPVPREMMRKELEKLIGKQNAVITISIPDGEELAKKTLNPKLGIIGGLSILGTTGIVRPMSEDALKDSLLLELQMRKNQGVKELLLSPGLSGETMAKAYLGQDICSIQMGNYVGFMIEEAAELGFEKLIIAGAVGKILKLSAGIMNTHSHIADGRNEILCTHSALLGASKEVVQELYKTKTTKKAMEILRREGLMDIWKEIGKRAVDYCTVRSGYRLKVRVILFDDQGNAIGDEE